MRKSFVALLLLFGAPALLIDQMPARADVLQIDPVEQRMMTRAKKLRSLDVGDPDTVWVGHVDSPTGNNFGVGANQSTVGGHGPFKIGRGTNLPNSVYPSVDGNLGFDGVWSFDHYQASETDSLQGWWPLARPYQSTGAAVLRDRNRPFFGFDHGNQGNYVLPQGAPKRTFGVVGYWHVDGGSLQPATTAPGTDHNPVNLTWSPLVGTRSAWCGIRSHGDITARDEVANGGTGNYFNATLIEYNGNNSGNQIGATNPNHTDKNFPGYGSQWDQMMYRDVFLADDNASTLTVSFRYATTMSFGKLSLPNIRVGWFDKDPLRNVALLDGNFISSSDAADLPGDLAPCDSFMVYVGVPAEPIGGAGNDFVASDGVSREIYDTKRRWFSEVIRINRAYRSILSRAGVTANTPFSITLPNGAGTVIRNILTAPENVGAGGNVRICFRVKTNRAFDDEDFGVSGTFTSNTAGAAIVDDVVANAVTIGDFEAANSINNSVSSGVITTAWRSTGKPPKAVFHLHSIEPGFQLVFNDPCGALSSANRLCNLRGRVATPGDHDLQERTGGPFGANDQDRQKWFCTPTINLMSTGPGNYNGQGIDQEIADVDETYNLWYDVYTNAIRFAETGNGLSVGIQAYPATQPNGVNCWGEVKHEIVFFSYNAFGCFQSLIPLSAASPMALVGHTSPDAIPDSLRVYIQMLTRCWTLTLTAQQCSPSTGDKAGVYFDNFSFMFIDGASPPQLSSVIWDLFNDAFPSKRLEDADDPSPGVAFDTLAAQVRTGYLSSQANGTLNRPNIAGDSAICSAADPPSGETVRVDMIFRILPGVGNYVTIGNRNSGVARRPDVSPRIAALATDVNLASRVDRFWGAYLASNGQFGTAGGHAGGVWSRNVWNSARMDTVENNLFPCETVLPNLSFLRQGQYMSHYHESDPKFTILGIPKNRCFLNDVSQGAQVDETNINCGALGTYPPTSYTVGATGYNPAEFAGGAGQTLEFTKILPDGQFTPGAHIEYFFRKGDGATGTLFSGGIGPDTNMIVPQAAEGSIDGHRWQEFGVLPDRWKDPAFQTGGQGMACMLFVDAYDSNGEELQWISIADSIGAIAPNKRGAHNGWRARGDQDIVGEDVGADNSICVREHIGQAGTVFDMYGCKGGESNVPAGNIGGRDAAPTLGLAVGKETRHAPTGAVLRGFYRFLFMPVGALGASGMGPVPDKTDDDIGRIQNFITSSQPTGTTPRFVWMQGRDLVFHQSQPATGHPGFFENSFSATIQNDDYRLYANNPTDAADFIPQPPIWTTGATYGMYSPCFLKLDVMRLAVPGITGASASGKYSPVPDANDVAGVYAPVANRNATTVVEGWSMPYIGTRFFLRTQSMLKYYFDMVTYAFGQLNPSCVALSSPVGVGDAPNTDGRFVNFMNLRSDNPMRSGEARIAFGVTKTEKVEVKIYDVSGRLVKTVANRVFEGGTEHVVSWDGTNDRGQRVSRGVYFYQLRSPSFLSQKKLAVLKN